MSRTCIICGLGAGSAEHVFPAALGGRRKNKAIYCDQHNNAYSGLVARLSTQLEAFNALVGVRPDRKNEPRSATGIDQATGLPVSYSVRAVALEQPHLMAEIDNGDGTATRHMRFSSRDAANKYVAEREALGETVTLGPESRAQMLHGEIGFDIQLGGTEGLRAIAYVLQTYLAQHFGDVARSPAIAALKDYTLGNSEGAFVWWDFDLPDNYPPNAYEFGHRVVVGVDSRTGMIFGRMSLFSTLHFAAELGHIDAVQDRPTEAVIVDIDPLAEHPPLDIRETRLEASTVAPSKPKNTTEGLGTAIISGEAHASMHLLIGRIQEHVARRAAASIVERLNKAATTREHLDRAIEDLREELSQRAFNLLQYAVNGFAAQPGMQAFAPILLELVKLDPTSIDGLAPQASATLSVALDALIAKLREEFISGGLTNDKAYELIASGPGAHTVGQAVLMPFVGQVDALLAKAEQNAK
ncbi:hypothetical protein [Paraburkholderia graminis]|uniref:hypothetical protein n=1 Tax=Paraburkholderia graminis TaxID=60548 RepID=UPI000419A430|nr:hypothetical protein [Paraburkholderia graminis]MDQ0627260.1 hypothetical protein [Paraburkholderia graminis]